MVLFKKVRRVLLKGLSLGLMPFLIYGMGSQPSITTPVPAQIIDDKGKVHQVDTLVCDDKTYFEVNDGSAVLKIPFDKIKKVLINAPKNADYVNITFIFFNGEKKSFQISPDVLCTGSTTFGTLEIYINQIKEIDFNPQKEGGK